ncbi:GerAB/ArcD/ProY family transporter [Desulforamulus aquiferis]|uniref:Endospore germination permease n=1 Tax=Desulforamulus aquiferis TaxID=1397668 RepID=A0AAW7ZBN8_9FIRM|nr:endospore germination permease [Desulforamulus aquiferis]MDO7786639.1 endospore germination permease [Desulforamulus aquiferis]
MSSWQATAYIIMLILPTAILFVPSITAQSAGPDGWASLILALVFGLLVAVVSSSLAMKFPSQTVIEYAPRLLGPYVGKLVGFIYSFYFYYVGYYVLRQFAEVMTTGYMTKTPLWVHLIILVMIASYALYLGLETLCRTNAVITIFFLASISVIVLFVWFNIDFENFKPILATAPEKIILGSLSPGSWFGECAVILMLAPFLADKKKATHITVCAVAAVFLCMLLITVGVIGLFGAESASRMVIPTFSMARNVRFETLQALERVDVLFMAVWVAGMIFKLATFFFAGTLAFAQLFNISSYRLLIIPGAVLLTSLALVSWGNIAELIEFSSQVFPVSINFVNFFLTSLLLVFVNLKAEGRAKDD